MNRIKLFTLGLFLGATLIAGCTGSKSRSNGSNAGTRPAVANAAPVESAGSPAKPAAVEAIPTPATKVVVDGTAAPVDKMPVADKSSDVATPVAADDPKELLVPAVDGPGYGAESYRIVSSPDEIITVLKNGATVICKRVKSPVVSVRAYANTGGVYEGKWLGGGLSHLLEHLVVGGSTEARTEEQNRDLLQKIGNDSNAYTYYDRTVYFINTTTEHMETAADLVCGWMLGARITPAEYRREYQVVQRELEMGKGEPDRVFWYLSASNRYRVNPMKVPVIGYQEVIQGLSRDDVYAYFKLAYVPNNLMFAVAGDVPPEQMLSAIQKHVKHARPGREFSRDVAPEPPVLAPRTVVATFPKLGQARLQLGFPTVRMTDPDLYALDLLATALGGGESSLLVQKLRDEKELVSDVSVMNDTPSYVDGTFGVDMQLDPAKVPEASKALLETLRAVASEGIDAGRLERAKTQMKAARFKRMQTSEDVAEALAVDLMSTGDPHFSERYVEAIGKVTPEQVKEVAKKYFDERKLLTTALLPAEFAGAAGLPKAEELLRAPVAGAPATKPAGSDITRVELDDDTTLLVKRVTTSPLVSIQLYSLGGVTAEDARTNGLGNLAMQMTSRGTTSKSVQQVAEFWDAIGGDYAAACGNNTWSWMATCLSEDFAKAFEMFADQVKNPAFTEAEVAQMKQRVLAQIESQDADWTDQAFRFFKKSYYGPAGSPYQFMSIGTPDSVQKLTADQARDYYVQRIRPGKRVLAVFGDVEPAEAERLARKAAFGQGVGPASSPTTRPGELKIAAASTRPSARDGAGLNVVDVKLNKTEQALAGVVIGFRSDSVLGEPDTFPLAVADTMASGYQYGAGYLYEILRGRGLVYVVHGQNSPGLNQQLPGTFLVYAGCEPEKVNEVIDVILENVARLQGTPQDLGETWFSRSKDLIVVAEAMESQTPAQQGTQAALDELYGLGYSWHQKFADEIKQVDLAQVRNVSSNRLDRCVVTVSTPKPELVNVKSGERRYGTFPKVEMTPKAARHEGPGNP